MAVPPTQLDALRRELKARRRRAAATQEFYGRVRSESLDALLAHARCIGLYRAAGGEPDPFPLVAPSGVVTALPALDEVTGAMAFRIWSPGTQLVPSPWKGEQPADTSPRAEPDVIFVPLLGFDDAFNRIGQGGGHYDRYLAAHPWACRIGVAWEEQRVAQIDARTWDVPLDGVLTNLDFYEKDLRRCLRQ